MDPITDVMCFETGGSVVLSWSSNTTIGSIVIEIDNGGEMGLDVFTLSGSETSFGDAVFRPGVTGYLITPFAFGSELKSSACYIRRGDLPGQVPNFFRGDMNLDGMVDLQSGSVACALEQHVLEHMGHPGTQPFALVNASGSAPSLNGNNRGRIV